MRLLRACVACALVLMCASHVSAQAARVAPSIDTLLIREHTRVLADDSLLGRGTGTAGERAAAAYIAAQLERIGLDPARGTSYLLPIPLRAAHITDESSVELHGDSVSVTFRNGEDFIVNTGGHGAFHDFRGRAVFFGQPIHAAALVTAQRSMVGRVAVFLGPLGGAALELVPALSRAGAAGIILLVPDAAQYDLYVRSRGDVRYFVDAPVEDPVWQPGLPVLIAGPRMTDSLLAHADLPAALVQGTATEPAELQRTVIARIDAHIESVPSANVGGVLRGADPALANEYIVYTAHYDHLGSSVPDESGDSIYNGFSDNAAGVAMLLAIAEAMSTDPPARSVAFLFFSGEERGLLGSSYLASAPPFPLEHIRGVINLDAGAPPAPPLNWRIAGGEGSSLGALAQTVAESRGWTAALSGASPNSDYWPFLQRGVPSIFIIPGDQWENITPDQRDALRRRWDRYHRADDHWHPEFPWSGLQRYAEYALLVGLALD